MQIVNWISNNYIEIFGAITGILYVFLEIRQNVWLWPVGIITSAVYIYVFFTGKLYADMSLQGYYLAISVIGWYWWINGREQGAGSEGQGAGSGERGADGRGPGAGSRGHKNEGEPRSEATKFREAERGDEATRSEATKFRETECGAEEICENLRDLREKENQKTGEGRPETGEGRQEERGGKLKVTRLKRLTGIILAVVFIALYTGIWMMLDRYTDSPVPAFDSYITSLSIVATWMLARKIYEHWFLWIVVNFSASILFFTRELYPTVILYIVYCVMSFAGLIEWKKSLKTNT